LTHWYHTSREWIKKSVTMDGLYVLNNPWAVQSMEKSTTYCAMMRLGLPIPEHLDAAARSRTSPATTSSPRCAATRSSSTSGRSDARSAIPLFMKPYDGGGWVGVTKIDDEAALRDAYDKSGKKVMQLQQAILPFDLFVRCVGLGPQIRIVRYDPAAPLHARYIAGEPSFVGPEETSVLRDTTLTINSFFGWDFNSCESLRRQGTFHPIDYANPCPDSQVTSLHYHFPWIVKANIRWSVFVAATRKKMRQNLDWEPFFAVKDKGFPTARPSPSTRRSPTSVSRPRGSRSSATSTSRTSTRSLMSSSERRSPGTPSGRR
jgi:hypothetical protein